MTTFHETYGGGDPVAFEGERADLRGGEYLGGSARPELFGPGDIITVAGDDHYFDPELRIPGHSFVSDGGFPKWCAIARKDTETAQAPFEPPQPCLDADEDDGTTFPCSHCAATEHLLAGGLCIYDPKYGEPS